VKPYRLVDHTADLGLEVFGKTGEELFANAASAVCELIVDRKGTGPTVVREMSVEGADREDLLVNFLREVLFLFNGEKMVPTSFTIEELDDRHLRGNGPGGGVTTGAAPGQEGGKAVTLRWDGGCRDADGMAGKGDLRCLR